ncbi:hypothetical protein EMIT093MI4_20483 [Pseudomonas sp. IT-93MI4]
MQDISLRITFQHLILTSLPLQHAHSDKINRNFLPKYHLPIIHYNLLLSCHHDGDIHSQ